MYRNDNEKTNVVLSICLMLGVLCTILLLFMNSCTYNVSMVHSSGSSTDAIDTDQKTDPDISPTLTIPVKPI